MFGQLRTALNAVRVVQNGDMIDVTGIPAALLQRDIATVWRTSRINGHMFSITRRNRIVFNKFYAIEFLYLLDRLEKSDLSIIGKRVIKKIRKEILTSTWISKIRDFDDPDADDERRFVSKIDKRELSKLVYNLKDYQDEFLDVYDRKTQMYDLDGYYLAGKPGSGKSLTALALATVLKKQTKIIFSPKPAVEEVWVKELHKHFKKPPTYWYSTSGKPLNTKAEYLIVHYNQISEFVKNLRLFKDADVQVIIDEGHNFNRITSDRTKALIEFCKGLNNAEVLWLSGTPLKSIGSEVIPFLHTVDPYFTDRVEVSFKKIFGLSTTVASDILKHRMGLMVYKVETDQFMDSEPKVETLEVKIPDGERFTLAAISKEMAEFIEQRFEHYESVKDEHRKIYDRCIAEHAQIGEAKDPERFKEYKRNVKILSEASDYGHLTDEMAMTNKYEKEEIIPHLPNELKKPFRDSKSVVKYVQLKIRGEALGRILGKRRTECHVEMLKHTPLPTIIDGAESKTIIFSSFVDVVKKGMELLKDQGYSPYAVYGETNKDLTSIVSKFERSETKDPLLATLQSLSTAVPMTMANTIVFTNAPFRIHEREQAIARVHRMGQKHQTYVIDVMLDTGGEPNISTRSTEIMEWSKELVDAVMGGSNSDVDISMEELALPPLY